MRGLADYAAKTLKSARVDEADILILPSCGREVAGSAMRQLDPKEKAIKDIQAATNTSPDVASALYDQMLEKEGRRPR
jgi:hypothetical protein